jgi:hypothetical protein
MDVQILMFKNKQKYLNEAFLNKFLDLLFATNRDSLKLKNQTVKVRFRFKVLLRFVLEIDPLLLVLFECRFQLCEKLLKVVQFK